MNEVTPSSTPATRQSNGFKRKTPLFIPYDLSLDGHLPSPAKATFVKELIKYLLYDRNQIADTLEMIQRKEEEHIPSKLRPSLVQRRRAIFLSQVEAVFSFIDDSFSLPVSPRELVLVFGSTLVSPKESYLITFPAVVPEEQLVSRVDSSLRKLFTKIVGEGLTGELQGHSKLSPVIPSTLHVAVKAKRSSRFCQPHLCRPHLNGLGHLQRSVMVSLGVRNSQHESGIDMTMTTTSNVTSTLASFQPFCDDDVDDDDIDASERNETINLQKLSLSKDEEKPREPFKQQPVQLGKPMEKWDDESTTRDTQLNCDEDSVWFVCTHSVKGLKPKQN